MTLVFIGKVSRVAISNLTQSAKYGRSNLRSENARDVEIKVIRDVTVSLSVTTLVYLDDLLI